jgi:hypothetical protein
MRYRGEYSANMSLFKWIHVMKHGYTPVVQQIKQPCFFSGSEPVDFSLSFKIISKIRPKK